MLVNIRPASSRMLMCDKVTKCYSWVTKRSGIQNKLRASFQDHGECWNQAGDDERRTL